MTKSLRLYPPLGILGVLAIGWLASSCSQVGDTWLMGSTAAAAKDQIMLVRKDPPSFGYQRLVSQTTVYPDMDLFVSQRGVPNFLAETGNRQRRYFILYYLGDREAFACRVGSGRSPVVEFAGPYPVTDREFRLLDGFRRNPDQTSVKL